VAVAVAVSIVGPDGVAAGWARRPRPARARRAHSGGRRGGSPGRRDKDARRSREQSGALASPPTMLDDSACDGVRAALSTDLSTGVVAEADLSRAEGSAAETGMALGELALVFRAARTGEPHFETVTLKTTTTLKTAAGRGNMHFGVSGSDTSTRALVTESPSLVTVKLRGPHFDVDPASGTVTVDERARFLTSARAVAPSVMGVLTTTVVGGASVPLKTLLGGQGDALAADGRGTDVDVELSYTSISESPNCTLRVSDPRLLIGRGVGSPAVLASRAVLRTSAPAPVSTDEAVALLNALNSEVVATRERHAFVPEPRLSKPFFATAGGDGLGGTGYNLSPNVLRHSSFWLEEADALLRAAAELHMSDEDAARFSTVPMTAVDASVYADRVAAMVSTMLAFEVSYRYDGYSSVGDGGALVFKDEENWSYAPQLEPGLDADDCEGSAVKAVTFLSHLQQADDAELERHVCVGNVRRALALYTPMLAVLAATRCHANEERDAPAKESAKAPASVLGHSAGLLVPTAFLLRAARAAKVADGGADADADADVSAMLAALEQTLAKAAGGDADQLAALSGELARVARTPPGQAPGAPDALAVAVYAIEGTAPSEPYLSRDDVTLAKLHAAQTRRDELLDTIQPNVAVPLGDLSLVDPNGRPYVGATHSFYYKFVEALVSTEHPWYASPAVVDRGAAVCHFRLCPCVGSEAGVDCVSMQHGNFFARPLFLSTPERARLVARCSDEAALSTIHRGEPSRLGKAVYERYARSVEALEGLRATLDALTSDALRSEKTIAADRTVKHRCVVPFAALVMNPNGVEHFCELVSASPALLWGKVRITSVPRLVTTRRAYTAAGRASGAEDRARDAVVDVGVVATVSFLMKK
jgi:hypothetical protein